uniref:Uncharacterized protein n=1 Tax=Ditylenchus dipsaci TaxID=166011 RepID=A0A915DJ19_9BILA
MKFRYGTNVLQSFVDRAFVPDDELRYFLLGNALLIEAFEITVEQHFYARHRIVLEHPLLPVIIDCKNKGHQDYYPLELTEIRWSLSGLKEPELLDAIPTLPTKVDKKSEIKKQNALLRKNAVAPLAGDVKLMVNICGEMKKLFYSFL